MEHPEIVEILRNIQNDISAIRQAFPADDMAGHRRYHEAVIEWQTLRNRLVRESLVQAAKVGTIAAMGWVLYALWVAIKMEFSK